MLPNSKIWTAEDYRTLAEDLGQAVVLFHVQVSWWRSTYALTSSAIVVDGHQIKPDDNVKPGRVRVMEANLFRKFGQVENEIRQAAASRAIEIRKYQTYRTKGGELRRESRVVKEDKLVPRIFKDEIQANIDAIKVNKWDPLVQEFGERFDSMIKKFKEEQPLLFKCIENHPSMPGSAEEAKKKFNVWTFPTNIGYRADDLTMEALEKGAGDYLLTIRESIFRQAIENLQTNAKHMLMQLGSLDEKGKVRSTNIENLLSAITMFKSLSSMMPDSGITDLINKAENLLDGTSSKALNANVSNTAEVVSQVLTQITESISADDLLANNVNKKRRKILI